MVAMPEFVHRFRTWSIKSSSQAPWIQTAGSRHDGDTPGVGVALVGCPGSLVCVTVCLCCTVVPRLAALRCGSSARATGRSTTT